ncbi:hypothetical protein [Roseivivax sediminis]|uniref:Uncharacterized protein n=1 Tax=Roseivivax sediminis TaxID=936889 RepID=A0A1I1WFP5_9RHOB|nr:hypothetical protein [Roseivivax sediminis]SFD93809.1 hypothetical protein SAMN04515678_104290 [Roseivivax sediminis]
MAGEADLTARVARIETLMAERLGLKSGTLRKRATRAGRDLPRGVRRDLGTLAEAAHLSGHPRLRPLIDPARVGAAADRAEAHLRGIDVRDRRIGKALGLAATLAVNLGLLAVLLLVLLRWRGLL